VRAGHLFTTKMNFIIKEEWGTRSTLNSRRTLQRRGTYRKTLVLKCTKQMRDRSLKRRKRGRIKRAPDRRGCKGVEVKLRSIL
jgi:hypothetical protein